MENKIIKLLKDYPLSTTVISNELHRNFYDTVKILKKMDSDGKIERMTFGKFTFWNLKKEEIKNDRNQIRGRV